MLREIKVYATRVVLKCLKCHKIVESEMYRNVEVGRTARLMCTGCNKPNAHMAIAHIHTYEELDDVVWPPPAPPGVSISPIVRDAIEVDTDLIPSDTHEAYMEEPEGDPEEVKPEVEPSVEPLEIIQPIPEGEGLEVPPEGDPAVNEEEEED